jgi:hypothetical protein
MFELAAALIALFSASIFLAHAVEPIALNEKRGAEARAPSLLAIAVISRGRRFVRLHLCGCTSCCGLSTRRRLIEILCPWRGARSCRRARCGLVGARARSHNGAGERYRSYADQCLSDLVHLSRTLEASSL